MAHVEAPPAGAQTVAAEIHGQLHIARDDRCDVTGDHIDDAGTSHAVFCHVTLVGVFTGPESGYIGSASTPRLDACVGPPGRCPDPTTGSGLPLQRCGIVYGGTFGSAGFIGRTTGGAAACISGVVTGGEVALSGATAEASLDLKWDVFTPDPDCWVNPYPPIEHGEARDVVAEFVTVPGLSTVGLVGHITPPSTVQVDQDFTPCTRELLIDPFFEIRMSPFDSPETSLCIVVRFPIQAGLRVVLGPPSSPLIPAPSP